ncbi:hypothetical protein WJX72_003064 [[Myrmecia] bisecta]|uniref:Uncharacterized protein n=1 Tax=[Myrmecia] bisecta TaxID=41462 RepID=A0AAW1PWE8_9CHLO
MFKHCPLGTDLARPVQTSVVAMAAPRKKGLGAETVKIYCARCLTQLYKYQKSGTGALVKAFHERIVEDHADGQLSCPKCGGEFARPAMIRGRPANKFIGGKVIMKK